MVTCGGYWHQCTAAIEVIDNHFTALCCCFIIDSLGSDIRADNFMQWSMGKQTFLHSLCPINTPVHFLLFFKYCFHLIIFFSLHLFQHFLPSLLQYTFVFFLTSRVCLFLHFFIYFVLSFLSSFYQSVSFPVYHFLPSYHCLFVSFLIYCLLSCVHLPIPYQS